MLVPAIRFGSLQLNRHIIGPDEARHYSVLIANAPIGYEDRVYLNGLFVGQSPTVGQLTRKYREKRQSLHEGPEVAHDILSFLANPKDLNTDPGEHTTLPWLNGSTAADYFWRHYRRLHALFSQDSAIPIKRMDAGYIKGLGLLKTVSVQDDL